MATWLVRYGPNYSLDVIEADKMTTGEFYVLFYTEKQGGGTDLVTAYRREEFVRVSRKDSLVKDAFGEEAY